MARKTTKCNGIKRQSEDFLSVSSWFPMKNAIDAEIQTRRRNGAWQTEINMSRKQTEERKTGQSGTEEEENQKEG